jgi:hypothetical protein
MSTTPKLPIILVIMTLLFLAWGILIDGGLVDTKAITVFDIRLVYLEPKNIIQAYGDKPLGLLFYATLLVLAVIDAAIAISFVLGFVLLSVITSYGLLLAIIDPDD